ncbi:hypothetical protein C8R45DRAFT_782318, partial [Mycena sanguinolenta]
NLVCTNPTCGAEGKQGHTIDNCFWPGGGKAGQFPAWWCGKRPAWTIPALDVDTYQDPHDGVSSLGRSSSTNSFEIVSSGASDASSFILAELSDNDLIDEAAYTVITDKAPVNTFQANSAGRTVAILDTGCTNHCFSNCSDFESYQAISDHEGSGVEGLMFRIVGSGIVRRTAEHVGVRRAFEIEALHTPKLTCDLISISKLDVKGFTATFSAGKA